MERKAYNIARAIIAVFISVCIALVPLDIRANPPYTACLSTEFSTQLSGVNIQKSEAHALPVAIPAAGAALAALAAELGISETALAAGIIAIGIGATGLAAYNAAGTDSTLAPAPGFAPWDDLTPQEKLDWVGQDGTAQDYQEQTIAWWALKYGLLEQTPNGDLQPTDEPDPENQNDHQKWQKARNVVIALAAGGGAVALNDALGPLVDAASGGLRDLIFGKDNLALKYEGTLTGQSGYNINVGYFDVPGLPYNEIMGYRYFPNASNTGNYILSTVPGVNGYSIYSSGRYQVTLVPPSTSYKYTKQNVLTSSNNTSRDYLELSRDYYGSGSAIEKDFFNPMYSGTLDLGDGTVYQDYAWTGLRSAEIDYGQLIDTPSGITENILNQPVYNNFVNNYTNYSQDEKRALTVPSGFYSDDFTPTYEQFVGVKQNSEITPIPDSEQLPTPGPNPNPGGDEQFQEDFGERVGQLLAQPFDQLFPFCLIGDLRRLTGMIEDAVYGQDGELSAQDVTVVNGTEKFVIPLSGFGNFFDDIEFEIDLTPVTDLAAIIRPFLTALFIVGLLVGTFRFFLNRGGE